MIGLFPKNIKVENGMPNEDWKRELSEIFFARSSMIMLVTLVIFCSSVVIALVWPKTYVASASVLMRNKRLQTNPDSLQQAEVKNMPLSKQDILSEQEILNSPDLIRLTVAAMKGVSDPNKLTESQLEEVDKIRENLVTQVVPSSHVIRLQLNGYSAEWTERTLDTLLDEYFPYRAKVYNPGNQEKFLADRAELYRTQLEEIEDQMVRDASKSSITLVDREMQNNADLKRDMEKELSELRSALVQMKQQIEPLKGALEDHDIKLFSFLDNLVVNDLGATLMQLSAEHGQALRGVRADSPKIKAIEVNMEDAYTALSAEVSKILDQKENEIQASQARIEHLEQASSNVEARNVELQKFATQRNRKIREAELLQNSYETFTRRREEARINSAISQAQLSSDISILSRAASSAEIVFPIPLMTVLFGLLVGVLTGCSLGFIVEFLDHNIKRPGDVERYVNLPVICSIKKV